MEQHDKVYEQVEAISDLVEDDAPVYVLKAAFKELQRRMNVDENWEKIQ